MGSLKPIGSEKLEGMAKINRILEISRYKENTPTRINEDKSVEYNITLSDNRNYRIDKEKNGYVIKRTLSESTTEYDYIEPMKNRKYYNSYSQALKRLNIIAKEVNQNENFSENVSLFNEGDNKTKYVLKYGETNEQVPPKAAPAPAPVPAPAPAPSPAPAPAPSPAPTEEPPMDDELDDLDLPDEDLEDDLSDEDLDDENHDDEDVVTYKTIQKLTGKLGQKIRAFNSDEDNEMSSKDIKYVINSILSALNLDDLDEEDVEDIMDKLEGSSEDDEDFDSEEDFDNEEDFDSEEDFEDDEEVSAETPEPPVKDSEMAEGFEFDDEVPNKPSRFSSHGLSDDDSSKVEEMFETIFSESKVDKVISKYFKENVIKESKVKNKKDTIKTIKQLSENVVQEFASLKILETYPTAKFSNKSNNNGLVFVVEDKTINVSVKGGYRLI